MRSPWASSSLGWGTSAPHSLLTGEVLQALQHLSGPALGFFQYAQVYLVLGGSEQAVVLQVQSHQCWAVWKDHLFFDLLVILCLTQPRIPSTLLEHQSTVCILVSARTLRPFNSRLLPSWVSPECPGTWGCWISLPSPSPKIRYGILFILILRKKYQTVYSISSYCFEDFLHVSNLPTVVTGWV